MWGFHLLLHRADVHGRADAASPSAEHNDETTSVILSPASSEPTPQPWTERSIFNSSPLSLMSTSSHASFPSSPNSASLASTSSLSPLLPTATFCESNHMTYIASSKVTQVVPISPHRINTVPIACMCMLTYLIDSW